LSRLWKRTLLLVVLAVLGVGTLWLTPLQGLERSTGLGALYAFRGIRTPPDSVVIVALDAQSAQQLGVPRRPDLWPRRLHARMVDGLVASGAVAIGFDLLFEQAGDPADDQAFAEALQRAGNVVLAERVVRHLIHAEEGELLAGMDRLIRPIDSLALAAWVTAPFLLPKTTDGVFEFWTFPTGAGGNPSMPVRLYEKWSSHHQHARNYPTGAGDRLALNLYGPFGTIPIISYADALDLFAQGGRADGVAGKVVLVGLAEPNQSLQFDAYRTPYSAADGVDINGVELAATAIANMIEGSSLVRVGGVGALILVCGWTAALALMWSLVRADVAAVGTLIGVAAYGVAAVGVFTVLYVWPPLIFPMVVVPIVVAGIGMALKYRFARGRKRRLHQLIGTDQDESAMARLGRMLDERPEGRVVRAVCLSSDIAAYTSRAEGISPDEARDMLNRYLAEFLPVVESHGGDVTDLVGDSLMSLWIVGDDEAEACRRAVDAALKLNRKMNRLGGEGSLPTRFGLHLGEVFFGELGVGERLEIRPVGDVVNTASRIQSACKPLGVTMLASQLVSRHLDGTQVCEVGAFRFKGKSEPLPLSLLDLEGMSGELKARFERAVSLFLGARVDEAQAAFSDISEQWPAYAPAHFFQRVCLVPSLRDGTTIVLTRA